MRRVTLDLVMLCSALLCGALLSLGSPASASLAPVAVDSHDLTR